ncbi:MAG: BatA domain-containing protein [Bacteroidota bacterium]
MQFLFPGFLWALLALSIPIIIHLFYFRRFKKVYFTNVRFLKEVKEESSARSRLRNLLVLLMRLLALAFLIFAFAQPFIPTSDEAQQGQKAVSVYVDNSFSMESLSEDIPLLERAKRRAKEIIAAYAENDRFQVLTNDFEGRHQRLLSQEDALAIVDEIAIRPSVRALDEVLERQRQVLQTSDLENLVAYQVSDFQQNTSADLSNWQDTSLQVNLIPLQAVQENNISIDSAWFESPVQVINQTNPLLIKVRNWGNEDAENIRLSMNYGGQEQPIGSLSIPAGEAIIDTAQVTILRTGWQQATLNITDYPITFDDRYFLTFQVAEKVNMLSIYESVPSRYVTAAFANNPYFDLDNQSSQGLDYSSFSTYQLIILNDLTTISSGLSLELNQYVNNGGNVLIFPSANANTGSYNQFLRTFPADELRDYQPQQRVVGSINTDEFIFNDVFENTNNNLKLPVSQANYRLSSFSTRGQETLLVYRDGSPYLTKYQVGQGNLYLSAAPLNEELNDLVRNGEIFVPMIFKMAISAGEAPKIAYTIGQDRVLEAEHRVTQGEQIYQLRNASKEFIPEQRIARSKVVLNVNNQIEADGIYSLSLEANETLHQYAFNYDRQESNLTYFSADDLARQVGERMTVLDEAAEANFEQLIGERSRGKILWRWCLILALIFLGIEVLLLRLWKSGN